MSGNIPSYFTTEHDVWLLITNLVDALSYFLVWEFNLVYNNAICVKEKDDNGE